MPPIDRPRPFMVASIVVPVSLLEKLDSVARLDGIGPAYFAGRVQLPLINTAGSITLSSAVEAGSSDDDATD